MSALQERMAVLEEEARQARAVQQQGGITEEQQARIERLVEEVS